MGAGRSKICPVTYDDACRRVTPEVLQRIEETFRRSSSGSGHLAKITFIRDILGENVPDKLSDAIYRGFGGGDKGLTFKELLSGLVLLVHGSKEEKTKFLSQMLSEDGEFVVREKVEAIVKACDSNVPGADLGTVFKSEPRCRVEDFQHWLLQHPHMASFSSWLLIEDSPGFSLEGVKDALSFYETLGQKFGVSDRDVMDVEKTYWALKGSNKLDLQAFQQHFSSLLPEELIPVIFRMLDVNEDGHLDVSELLSAVSVWCSADSSKVHRFCFSVFDMDHDGRLSEGELAAAIQHMQTIQAANMPLETPPGTPPLINTVVNGTTNGISQLSPTETSTSAMDEVDSGANGQVHKTKVEAEEEEEEEDEEDEEDEEEEEEMDSSGFCEDAGLILSQYGKKNDGYLSEDEYVSWARVNPQLSQQLPHLLFQMSHVQLGVRPKSQQDEAKVIGGYLLRFAKSNRKPGELVYILCANWFKLWMEYTGYQGVWSNLRLQSAEVIKKTKRKRLKWKKKKKKKKKHRAEAEANHVDNVTVATWEGNDKVGECEVIEMTHQLKEKSPCSSSQSYVSASNGGSEPSILSRDADMPPPPPAIKNSALIVEEQTSSTKKPSLTNEGGKLRTNKLLVEHKDFILVPEVIWKVLVMWYCPGTYNIPALPRTIDQNGMVDLYPVFFKVYRHTTLPPPIKPSSLPWFLSSLMNNLGIGVPTPTPSAPLPMAVGSAGGEAAPPQPPTPRRVPYYTAAFVKNTTLADISEKLQQVLHVKADDLRVYNMVDENSPVLLEDETKTIEEMDFYQQKSGIKEGFLLLVETRNKDNTWPEEMIALVHEVQEKDKDKQKKKVQKSVHVQPGATGLSNLGNTCFMNSALQCVSNAKPLTQYFQKKDHLLEINKDNPLGMQGVMAKRYGELINELWSGNSKSITPLKFRFTVGRCAPHFTAFQQQDAQELLAFVLDGLHEDLNRVKDKAYKELSDSDGRPDEEVAKEAWDYHLSRNQSIVVDLFHGQLKSEVTCKTCQFTSVRFDPFTFLSLPLPMDSTVNLEVIVMYLDGSQPVKYGLKMEIDDRYSQLKEELSRLCGVAVSRLILAEVSSSLIRNLVEDKTKIRNALGGWLYAYELPPPSQVPTMQRSESLDEIDRQMRLQKVRRERTLSLKHAEKSRKVAARVKENLARRPLKDGSDVEVGEEVEACDGGDVKRQKVVVEVLTGENVEEDTADVEKNSLNHERVHMVVNKTSVGEIEDGKEETVCSEEGMAVKAITREEGGVAMEEMDHQEEGVAMEEMDHQEEGVVMEETDNKEKGVAIEAMAREEKESTVEDAVEGVAMEEIGHDVAMEIGEETVVGPSTRKDEDEVTNALEDAHRPLPSLEMFVYAVHRRAYTVEHYFLSSQQTRPILFSIPLIVPCTYYIPRRRLYEAVWTQFKRLIIPEPPSSGGRTAQNDTRYPFVLKQVSRDGLSCSRCPWHRFCRGCEIPCDYGQVGNIGKFIAIDWDETTFHLKYVMAQEKALEHESMESLKIIDTKPIDLYSCFRAFVRKDQLGEDESWYCKRCKTHREAVKSLEIWRLPPILIIHLKRFQFVNGHWIKSQRAVTFPLEGLDPLRYTVKNGNGRGSTPEPVINSESCSTSVVPMEVGPVSRGESPCLPETGSNSCGDVCQENEASGVDGGDRRDKGMAEGVELVQDEKEEHVERKRSAHVMGEVMEEEEGRSTGTAGSSRADATSSSAPAPDLMEEVPKLYNLFAISCHTGVLGGGHYTSFAKNISNNWYYFNDSSCKETTPERVEQESPYMLFYELKNMDSLSGQFRAPNRQGKSHQDIGTTEDDREYEETLKNIKRSCIIQ